MPFTSSEKLANILSSLGKTYDDNRKLLMMHVHYYRSNKRTHQRAPYSKSINEIVSSIIKVGQEQEEFRTDIPSDIIVEMFEGILKTAMSSRLGISFMTNLEYKLSLFLVGITPKSN